MLCQPPRDPARPALLVVVPQLRVAGDTEDVEVHEVGACNHQIVGSIRGDEPVIVAVENENRMPQLRRTGKHIEASEGDRSAGAGEGRRPVGTEDGDRQASPG